MKEQNIKQKSKIITDELKSSRNNLES